MPMLLWFDITILFAGKNIIILLLKTWNKWISKRRVVSKNNKKIVDMEWRVLKCKTTREGKGREGRAIYQTSQEAIMPE